MLPEGAGWELHSAYMALVDADMEHILPRELAINIENLHVALHEADEG